MFPSTCRSAHASRRWWLAWLAAVTISVAVPTTVAAERLPLRSYTTADGLAHDRVAKIVRDSRGFLWFCTAGGLSRFDGRTFVSYSVEDGLPIHTLNDLLETPEGSYWIATNGAGVVRYDPAAQPSGRADAPGTAKRFTVFSVGGGPATDRVNVVYRERSGRLWLGTDAGLFNVEGDPSSPTFRAVPLNLAAHPDHLLQIWALLEDPDGGLWIGTSAGLIRRWPDGRAIVHRVRTAHGTDHVLALVMDSDRQLWIGHEAGLLIAPARLLDGGTLRRGALWSTVQRPVTRARIASVLKSSDGIVWAGGDAGVYAFAARRGAMAADRVMEYGAADGLEGIDFRVWAEDVHGNIWIATLASGAIRIARGGLTTYTTSDGLDHDAVGALFEARSGELCAVSRGSRINVFDGRRFHTIVPRLPLGHARAEPRYALALHDRAGEWWIPSGSTLYRFPAVRPARLAATRPSAVYSLGGGSGARGIFRLFVDWRGDVWIARRVPSPEVLARLERANGTLHRYTERDGLPLSTVTAFAEDQDRNLWIGFWDGGLVRYRDGRFTTVTSGSVSALHVDRANRLWCATADGLIRMDNLSADSPRELRYTTKDGLSNSAVVTITEDASGRVFIGTRRGVDRLDPESGRIRHFTTADGLAALETRAAYRDRGGTLWFATGRGLSRLVPGPAPPPAPAPVALLQSVRIDGVWQPVPDLGSAAVGPLTAGSPDSRVEIEFVALSFRPGETLKYQYRLDDAEPWSRPNEQPSVTFPRLSPGTYRFSVRATAAGAASGAPAVLTFTIPPPMWARWWFLAAAVTAVIVMVHAMYRYRLGRLVEIERIRTRLAMDLHDDIGSTLSQVAVLSEVARKSAGARREIELLERIAEISRHLVDAMSDVVWAINPERDSLRDLMQRMRRFASDALEAQNIEFRLDGPADDLDVRLDGHERREVFLIFKEATNNLLRYANCTRADVSLRIEGPVLVLTIADNGVGVDPLAVGNGLGLQSMRQRAERLGGDLGFSTAPGRGTRVWLVVPLGCRGPRPCRRTARATEGVAQQIALRESGQMRISGAVRATASPRRQP